MLTESLDADVSLEPTLLRDLSEGQKTRLTELLDRYLLGLERGEPIDPHKIVLAHPDLSDIFNQYLEKLNALYGLVGTNGIPRLLSHMPLDAGTMQLGDFTILREIGRGGMGVVYEAQQNSLGRKVAIKLLPMAAMLDARQIARFRNEAHAAGLLQHPNIVPVYSVGVDRDIHYYAMQLIDGTSLDHWVRERGVDRDPSSSGREVAKRNPADTNARQVANWRTILAWTCEIASALHSAHEAGVVHRDVKPSNLMLDRTGKIWITDFGLARCQTEKSLTRSGDLVGTIRYMSPEQARGESALVDGRSDIYSLAVTVYELLTLQPVHRGEDAPTLVKQIDENKFIALRQLRADLPRDLETVLHKAISGHRDQRYQTALEFAEDLQHVLAGEPTVARPPTLPDHLVRWASKHRRSVLAGLLFGALALVGFAINTAQIAAGKRQSDTNAAKFEISERRARGAVDRLGSQMAELLEGIPAADSVRRRLLAETLDYYQQFAAGASHDPKLREDLAITYGKIGSLQNELGSHTDSIEALRASELIYASLVAARPSDSSVRAAWATSQNNLADALHQGGHFQESAGFFAKSVATYESLLNHGKLLIAEQASPDNSSEQTNVIARQLATTLNNLGLLLADSDLPEQAENSYVRALELLSDLNAHQESAEVASQLALVQTNFSRLLTERDPARAVELAAAALTVQSAALKAEPDNVKLATHTVVTLNTLGSAHIQDHRIESAVTVFRQAIAISEQLLLRWPHQPTYRRDLVLSLNHLGLAHSKLGQFTTACEEFQQAADSLQLLTRTYAADAETQSMLGGVLNNLGFAFQQLDQNESAANCYRQAVTAQSKAVELAPDVGRYRHYLKKHLANLASFEHAGEAI